MKVDFRQFCPSCSWCCHGEKVFVSYAEADRLGEDGFEAPQKGSGPCEKLDLLTGLCTIHEKRPIECRLFPLDILELEVSEGFTLPTWVLWTGPCPATTVMNRALIEATLRNWESKLTHGWIKEYLAYHKTNQPAKYATSRAIRLRSVRLT